MADSDKCVDDGIDSSNQKCFSSLNDSKLDLHPHKCLSDVLEISITESEKRHSNGTLNIKDAYIAYLVESKVIDAQWKSAYSNICTLWRRYREFEMLRNYLEVTYPFVVVPPLPEKKVSYTWQKLATNEFDPDFIERRRACLDTFLQRIASHPILSIDKIFFGFLQQENNWKETVLATGYLNKIESKLKVISATFRLKKPDKHFERIKNYSSELQSNISSLLKVRAKLADRIYGLHQIHRNYGRVFSEWSALEQNMGDGLQKAGHYMDVYAAIIDALLEEEELFADQMKEYLLYADSLKAVCKKQELLQYDIEQADENLSSKSQQRENLLQGKTSFVSRLMGNVDTDELRESKLQQLDKQIQDAEIQIRLATEELNKFVAKGTVQIEEFEQQKVKNIKDALLLYTILQVKRCRKGITVWSSIRECFENI